MPRPLQRFLRNQGSRSRGNGPLRTCPTGIFQYKIEHIVCPGRLRLRSVARSSSRTALGAGGPREIRVPYERHVAACA